MNPESVKRMLNALTIAMDRNPDSIWGRRLEQRMKASVLEAVAQGKCERPDVCRALLARTSDVLMDAY